MSPDTPPPREPPARSWPDVLKVWSPITLLGVAAFVVAWFFVEPAPPETIRLATGSPGGAYERMGQRYTAAFAPNGIGVELVATAGALENWTKLSEGTVDAAIVQGGTAPSDAAESMQAVVSVAFEPLFVFYREDALAPDAQPEGAGTTLPVVDRIDSLRGRHIAVGPVGSGTRQLVYTLMDQIGLDQNTMAASGTQLAELGGTEAADALIAGQIDAACFVMSPEAPLVQRLLAADGIGLIDFARAEAFAHRLPYLSAVTLDQGVVNPQTNLPRRDVSLVAPAAYLVVRNDTHRAVVQLLIEAAKDDRTTSMVAMPGDFPSLQYCDLPVADEAEFFFTRGPNILHRTLPFAVASLIDRDPRVAEEDSSRATMVKRFAMLMKNQRALESRYQESSAWQSEKLDRVFRLAREQLNALMNEFLEHVFITDSHSKGEILKFCGELVKENNLLTLPNHPRYDAFVRAEEAIDRESARRIAIMQRDIRSCTQVTRKVLLDMKQS